MINNTQTNGHQLGALTGANRCENYYELYFATGEVAHFYILADGIFRFFIDPNKVFNDNHTSFIQLANFDNTVFERSQVRATSDSLIIHSGNYQIIFGQKPVVLSIFDESLHKTILSQTQPLELADNQTSEYLVQNKNEFYFGGGLQNGYFSHKGHKIDIKCDRITGKDGVISQVPFFWSNAGFGELRNTAQVGTYDFGKQDHNLTTLSHHDQIFDSFYLIGNTPQSILTKYYQLTGKPTLLPKYTLKLGHIGNFCTTLWQPSQSSVRNATRIGNDFYTRTADENAASGKASLNGEENYQFSARAMLDRYHALHFNLGWFVPNYGVQTNSDQALSFFNDYALNQGIHPGFWHKDDVTIPEKTAFTFTDNSALTALDSEKLKSKLPDQRSFVLNSNNFMGMQKESALVYGDVGGNWESIATQVAGIIGSNLSGQPLTGAAIDGIHGGGNAQINVRDFEWKVFTPLLFNLDNQGDFSKTPFAYNKNIVDINRAYLRLRAKLASYLHTLNVQARAGYPILRPLFIEFAEEQVNYTDQFDSEFMLGSSLLIAPISCGREDAAGNARKDNLYLPNAHTMWIDLFTGEKYGGGRVYNTLSYPTWHLPVFVRGGSIFDFGNRDYLFYPQGNSETVIYDDDDSSDFEENHCQTHLSNAVDSEKLTITIDPVEGNYSSFKAEQTTNLTILSDSFPDKITVKLNEQTIPMHFYSEASTFNQVDEGIFFNANYSLPEFEQYHGKKQQAIQIKIANHDVTCTRIQVAIYNYSYNNKAMLGEITSGLLPSPKLPAVDAGKITAHSFELAWSKASEVQVEINGILYTGIRGNSFTFHELKPNTRYIIRMRYVSQNKVSKWSELFGIITKHAAEDYAIEDISVACNFSSRLDYPLEYLTDLKPASEWQTEQAISLDNPLILTFTFNDIEKLSRMSFVPRNIDHSGDPTDISLAISNDGVNYTTYAEHLQWKADSKNKVIGLRDVRAKSVKLTIYQSSGPIIAAREVIFFRAKS